MNRDLLPIPFLDNVPSVMRKEILQEGSIDGKAFCDYMDEFISSCDDLVRSFGHILSAERCPVQFLEELGYLLNAGIVPTDTESSKRNKIYSAVSSRLNPGSFENYIKALIDGATGFSSSIWNDYGSNYAVELDPVASVWNATSVIEETCIDESTNTLVDENGYQAVDEIYGNISSEYPWSIEATPGGSYLGMWEVGNGLEWVVPGNIFINLGDTGGLSPGVISAVLEILRSHANAAYFIVNIGYVSSGNFTIYGSL